MIKSISPLADYVVDDPCSVQHAQSKLEEITESGDCLCKASRARGLGAHEAVETTESRVEDDESKANPLDENLFFVSREESNEGLDLCQPEEDVGNNSRDFDLNAADHLDTQCFCIHEAG